MRLFHTTSRLEQPFCGILSRECTPNTPRHSNRDRHFRALRASLAMPLGTRFVIRWRWATRSDTWKLDLCIGTLDALRLCTELQEADETSGLNGTPAGW